jgi:hypothetical protein
MVVLHFSASVSCRRRISNAVHLDGLCAYLAASI